MSMRAGYGSRRFEDTWRIPAVKATPGPADGHAGAAAEAPPSRGRASLARRMRAAACAVKATAIGLASGDFPAAARLAPCGAQSIYPV